MTLAGRDLRLSVGAFGALCIGVLSTVIVMVDHAQGANTMAAKTYWHKVGNDRFRAYDVGGRKDGGSKFAPVTETGYPYGPGGPGYTAYSGEGKSNAQPNKRYAKRVDWPVTFIFKNASINGVKKGLARQGLAKTGSTQYMSLLDSRNALWDGNPYRAWDEDKGLKQVSCSSIIGLRDTWHIRLYADSLGFTKGTSDDRMYNPYWGFYVLGTTHIDHLECTPPWTWFGKSEEAEWHISRLAAKEWGGNRVLSDHYQMKNFESSRSEGDHVWSNNGWATVVNVGAKASTAGNPDDDPNPEEGEGGEGEEGEEGPPPPTPAAENDVDGDDKADLVTLHTSGNAYTYRGSNGSSVGSFSGTMEPAVFDADGFHVVDIADINGDGYSDMTTVHSAGVIFTFMGQSDGSFGFYKEAGTISPGYVGPGGHEPLGVDDIDGDGYGDLLTFYPPQGKFYIYPGKYDGEFGSPVAVGAGQNSALFDREGTWFLDLDDVNGDKKADLVGMTSYGAVVVYSVTTGGAQVTVPGLTVGPIMADGSGDEPVGLGDVNADGKADMATLNASGQIAVYAGTDEKVSPSNAYRYLKSEPVTSLSSQNSSLLDGTGDDFVGLLDISGDGKADLVKVTSGGDVYVGEAKSDLSFSSPTKWIGGVTSNRFGTSPGEEMAQEKPYFRRYGCDGDGCSGRPKPTEADVDGDRRADLVTLDDGGTAHVYRAIGDEGHATSFSGTMNSALWDGTGHYAIDTADVNGDGRADKVTLNHHGTVHVYPGKVDGTFGSGVASFSETMSPGPYATDGYEPIAVADVTGDARGDLLAFMGGQGVNVYPGKTDSTFGAAVSSLPSADSARFDQTGFHFLDAVDVTGDRRADLVAAGAQDDTVRVFKGNSNGTLVLDGVAALPLKLDEGSGQELLGLGDVNGDGHADLATLVAGTAHVYEGKASGEFVTEDAGGPSPAGSSLSGSLNSNLLDQDGEEVVGLLDENGDRRADLVTVRSNGGSARIYHGRANFTFNPSVKVNDLDALTPIRFNKPSGHEMITEKPAAFRAGCTSTDCSWPPVAFKRQRSDVDADYRDDLVAVDADGNANVFAGTRGGFVADPVESLEGQLDPALRDGEGRYVIDVADVNDDYYSDLVALEDDGKVLVHPGKEDRTFDSAVETGIMLPPAINGAGSNEPIAVADATGDGFDDLIAFDGTQINLYKGQSDGKFATSAVGSLAAWELNSAQLDRKGTYFLDVVDVDGDEIADLVTSGTSSSALRVFPGQSSGVFAGAVNANSIDMAMDDGDGAEPVGFGDVSGDGRADLLVRMGSDLRLFEGQSDAKLTLSSTIFRSGVDSSLLDGEGEELVGLLDHDGDGRADLVTVTDEDELLTYPAQTGGPFGKAQASEGSLGTVRLDPDEGHELAMQRPLVRRLGCKPAPTGCRWPASPPMSSDANGDGRSDIVTVDPEGTVNVFAGQVGGIDTQAGVASLTGSLNSAVVDGDGHYAIDVERIGDDPYADLVTIDDDGDLFTYAGQPSGAFAVGIEREPDLAPTMNGAGPFEPIGVGDVDGDGDGDLVTFSGPNKGRLKTFPGHKSGVISGFPFISEADLDSALPDEQGLYFLDVADVDGDLRADVLAADTTTSTLILYRGQANGAFAAGKSQGAFDPIMDDGSGEEPVGLADLTGDGKADLLSLDEAGELQLRRGYWAPLANGLECCETPHEGTIDSSLLDGEGEELLGLADHDGDGRADLTSATDEGHLLVYRAEKGGTLALPETQEGSLPTLRHGAAGHEVATERTLQRRIQCDAEGCASATSSPGSALEPENVPHGDLSAENWYAAEVAMPGTVQAKAGEWKLFYNHEGEEIQIIGCDTEFSGELAEDGSFAGDSSDPEAYCDALSLSAGQICVNYNVGELPEYWLRQDVTIATPVEHFSGATFGRMLEDPESYGNEYDRVEFDQARIGATPLSHDGDFDLAPESVMLNGGWEPCPWPELE